MLDSNCTYDLELKDPIGKLTGQKRCQSVLRPISWVLDGLPPNTAVWEKIVEKSAEVRQALTTKRATLEASRKAELEARKRAEEAMEEDDEGQQEKAPDPILEAARAAAEAERNKPTPVDPLPIFVFQLKDDVPKLVKQDLLDPAMEPMTDSQAAPTADDTTEAPPDLPASNVHFDPMPAPGPEVDYVLNMIRQFEAEWGKTTEFLGKTTSAYGYRAMFSDLDIGGKSYDDLYKEISVAIQKPLQRPAKESSQDELDEKADAEAEAFAEGGLEDYKPAGEEGGEEEEAEEEEEAKEEAEEGEEEEEEMQPVSPIDAAIVVLAVLFTDLDWLKEEDPSKGPTRQLGRTSYFCPVALKEFQIMKPGDPELVAEYLGKAYYFGTEEDRAKFLLEPKKYVDTGIQRPIKAIRAHLQDDEELPRESLDLLLKKFWTTEPYMSIGIILEGFPRNGEDVTYMQESNLFPDLCIAFTAEAEEIVPRLLPERLVKWKIKQARIEANKRIEIEWKKAKRVKLYEARKKQIMTELAVKRKAKLVSHLRY
ncbi:unnamed protein product [Dibothriocephalus latus]|uniref:Uncharacterized protein n=1 Tax=Dibothriocephalus latus TaxID=60516 RepID=A0A3P6TC48_DIBLA|nr:unnamed protein product [Dibothriocephalus latus]